MSKKIDHRALLLKYMRHVISEEGISFLRGITEVDGFTLDEIAELRKIEEEA